MSPIQIKKFIMYYERITKQMLIDLTKKAYAVLYLDKNHRFNKIKFNYNETYYFYYFFHI